MEIKKIFDISRKVHPQMTLWPGDSGVKLFRNLDMEKGDPCNLSTIHMGLHSGTHVDAPLHYIPGGKDISTTDVSTFIGNARVIESKEGQQILPEDMLDTDIGQGSIVIFKTKNSHLSEEESFQKEFVHLSAASARYLIEKKIKAVGIDYLSVDGFSKGHAVHDLLLENGIGIIEGLRLNEVKAGSYFFCCLPLNILHGDGAPARAILIEFA